MIVDITNCTSKMDVMNELAGSLKHFGVKVQVVSAHDGVEQYELKEDSPLEWKKYDPTLDNIIKEVNQL